MQESKTRSEKRSQLPGAAVPQNAEFSLDDALALAFYPWALMRTAAHKLLDQDGHSPLTSPRRKAICRDIKIQIENEQFHFGPGSHHFLVLLTGNPFSLHWAFCTSFSWRTCPEWRSRGAQVCGVQPYKQSSATKTGKIKHQAASFFFPRLLKLATRSNFHVFRSLCCCCFH